ncbi:nucleoside deaminase [Nocardia puris]|uniref:Cytidine/deoxycytidylate deaminase-like protein n=1 Tax=Nocardia puris TaxID=208602 RepID=A0A366DL79_9NOCA|nr:nucleoside deaminase [Nocardia puris]MBF6213002.1 nucleoside deaminase [Nocardia puris]MBF6367993.1 nucleoside deaminase [Nocardia puris]MBF6462626.1 nucleoside deaminase [Nocardia puris]RBO90249.1 cytidine/deoxycytidylate deaminase-like protein [Nocardia puris]
MPDHTHLTDTDHAHLRRCVDLAREALDAGDQPFGSVLVDADGRVLREARNRDNTVDHTQHPEFELARWAAAELPPQRRATSVVYTSGEHCPMCSAAHAWAGLGRIVYVASSAQLTEWRAGWGAPASPVAALPINAIAPHIPVAGPDPTLTDEIKALHARSLGLPEN